MSFREAQQKIRRSPRALGILIAISLIAGPIAVEFLFGALLDYAYAHSSRNPIAAIEHANADTLVIGSSSGKYAFAPSEFNTRVFNAAQNGQGAYYVATVLRQLKKETPVKRVIFAFDPADIVSGIDTGNIANLAKFAPWAGRDVLLREWISRGDPELQLLLRFALYRYRSIAPRVIKDWVSPEWSADGYEPLSPKTEATAAEAFSSADEQQEGQASTQQNPDQIERMQPSDSGIEVLQVIAEETRRLNLQLVLIATPLLNDQRGTNPKYETILATARGIFNKIRFCDLTLINDREISAISINPDYFFDGTHMTSEGAKTYSNVIDRLISNHCGAL